MSGREPWEQFLEDAISQRPTGSVFDELLKTTGYPKETTIHPSDGDWANTQREIGRDLPSSFKSLVSLYGPGRWGGHFEFFSPVKCTGSPQLTDLEIKDYLECPSADPAFRSLVFYPAENGLMPFTYTNSRLHFCWDTWDPNPDNWPIVAFEGELPVEVIRKTVPQFLLDYLRDESQTSKFPKPRGMFEVMQGGYQWVDAHTGRPEI